LLYVSSLSNLSGAKALTAGDKRQGIKPNDEPEVNPEPLKFHWEPRLFMVKGDRKRGTTGLFRAERLEAERDRVAGRILAKAKR
jgi:hypothetical protein